MMVLVATLAGATGAALRIAVGMAVYRSRHDGLPIGTAIVNVVGAFAYGVVTGSAVGGLASTASLGLLAGFTTFSAWMVDAVTAHGDGETTRSLAIIAVMAALGIAAAALGLAVGA